MTRKAASKRYNIPISLLEEYERWELDGSRKKTAGAWQYDDQDLERIGMIMTLYSIGFNGSEVETYMRLVLEGENTRPQRIAMLTTMRRKTLDEIHSMEKQISTMDYLRHKMQA